MIEYRRPHRILRQPQREQNPSQQRTPAYDEQGHSALQPRRSLRRPRHATRLQMPIEHLVYTRDLQHQRGYHDSVKRSLKRPFKPSFAVKVTRLSSRPSSDTAKKSHILERVTHASCNTPSPASNNGTIPIPMLFMTCTPVSLYITPRRLL